MNTNIFKFLDEDNEDILQNMRFESLEDLQNALMPQDPFGGIRTNKSFRETSNEIALETPLGKQSTFYKPTTLTQGIRRIEDFEVKIKVLVEDDLDLVRKKYNKEAVVENVIKLYIAVKDESIIDKGKQNDLRSGNIRLSNIVELTGIVLGDKIFPLFNDNPQKMDWYINKIAMDIIDDIDDAFQLKVVKKALKEKFDIAMRDKRSTLFPLPLVGQLIQQELKKDLQEFWKPILTSIAKEVRTLKLEDEKYWQPYTPEGKLKPSREFTPLIGKGLNDVGSNIQKFMEPFNKVDSLIKGYLDLSKIGNDNKFTTPAHNIKLKRALSQIYNLLKGFLNDFKAGLFSFIKEVADKIYQLNAFLVGIINGAIEFVASLFDLVGLLSGLLSGGAHILWQAIKKEFKNLKEKGAFTYLYETLGKFFADINKRYNTKQSQYEILKNLGEDLFGIVEFVLGAFAAFKVGKTVLKTAKESYDSFKKKIDDILGTKRNNFNETNNEIDELFRNKGVDRRDGGIKLTRNELRKFKKDLELRFKEFNLKVEIVSKNPKFKQRLKRWNGRRNTQGSFNSGPPPTIYVRQNCTKLTLQHEVWHMEDLKRLGQIEFKKIPNWKHEESIWNKIWNTKHKWTNEELVDSYWYYKRKALIDGGTPKILDDMEDLLKQYSERLKN